MGVEIERKFLVDSKSVPDSGEEIPIIQAYLCAEKDRTVRVRKAGERAFFTIKGEMKGISRKEFEYEIPPEDAEEMIRMAVGHPVEKVRRIVFHNQDRWEVDFFSGLNEGLVVAELELEKADEEFEKPSWIKEEVSGQLRYQNSQLAFFPYCDWK